jgi:PAS domain S-box-containing protein
MNLAMLLEDALAERGNAVAVIAHAGDGQSAVIQAANAPFARIMGWPADHRSGMHLTDLRPLIERAEDWETLIGAIRTRSHLSLDLKLRVNNREVWLGFSLTFKTDASDGDNGILIGRDITEARARTLRETESQRLLASVFLHVGAAVAIVSSEGAILMANPACHHLLGYEASELAAVNVEALTPPEFAEAARTARARQLRNGGGYIIRLDTFAKSGARVPVTLHSAQLRDEHDRRLRVVTLIPDPVPRDSQNPSTGTEPPEKVGQVHAISLTALKIAYGSSWPALSERAMALAEQIIRGRLGPADVLRRRDEHGFLVWFEDADETANLALLAGITREIREHLLTDIGDGVPDDVGVVSIDTDARSGGSPALSEQGDRPNRLLGCDAKGLLRVLGIRAAADVRPVTGRDGIARPIVLVDFIPAVRSRLYDLVPSLPREPDRGAGFDMIRLDLAVRELDGQREGVSVLTPISWLALEDAECRLALDQHLARMRAASRLHLMLAVSGVPHLSSAGHWSDIVGSLRRQLGGVGMLLTHRDGDLAPVRRAITSDWPLSLLVIDRTEGPPMIVDQYLSLIAAARRREIPVLVRTTSDGDIRDWREIGATMFVAAA